jgi:hypothetical protein
LSHSKSSDYGVAPFQQGYVLFKLLTAWPCCLTWSSFWPQYEFASIHNFFLPATELILYGHDYIEKAGTLWCQVHFGFRIQSLADHSYSYLTRYLIECERNMHTENSSLNDI